MKIVKQIDEKHFLGEEDGEKVLLVKKDLDLEKLSEVLADEDKEGEGEEYSWDDLKDMDYDELSELVDDEELEDIDVEDYDEGDDDEVEKLRVAIAKELDIEVPKKGKKGKK